MKIIRTHVYGFQMALEGMRNPKESWHLSDSKFWSDLDSLNDLCFWPENPKIGPNDLKLALKLIRGGSEHRKFLRQIQVWTTWVLPRYIHAELDTYKIATTRNSCSTIHKLTSRDLTPDDFEGRTILQQVLDYLNQLGRHYRERKEQKCTNTLLEMKKALPEGYLQKATWTGSYETLLNMYLQRKNHKLPEWSGPNGICNWIKSLPYMNVFISSLLGPQETTDQPDKQEK